jgi:hypothetical protein
MLKGMVMLRHGSGVALLVAGLSACLEMDPRGYPLYPKGIDPPTIDAVARLSGSIESVDGRLVPVQVVSFELWPGCHMVRTAAPALLFALPMQAGYRYRIERSPPAAGTGGPIDVRAVALRPDGEINETFEAATTPADFAECYSITDPVALAAQAKYASRRAASDVLPTGRDSLTLMAPPLLVPDAPRTLIP